MPMLRHIVSRREKNDLDASEESLLKETTVAPTTWGVVLEDDTTPAPPNVLLLDPKAPALAC